MNSIVWAVLAIAFIILLIKFPKKTLVVAAILSALTLAVFGILAHNTEKDREEYKAEQDRVVVTVAYNNALCGPAYPLQVTIQNNGTKTVSRVNFRLGAYLPGYSTNHAGYEEFTSDKIIKSGESFFQCFRIPTLGDGTKEDTLQWRIEDKTVYFSP
jgi:hypothetical protein